MSHKQPTATTVNASSVVMKRKAINSYGRLGSLYDGCTDRLLVQYNMKVPRQQFKSFAPTKCIVINGSSDVSRDVLRIIGIEDDLRLSLLLNLTHQIGIVAILNDSDQINEHTRVLYYSWVDREERVSDEVLKNVYLNKLLKNTTSATHIIAGINFGIDVIVILHLPSDTSVIIEIDRILQKISSSLSSDTDIISPLTYGDNDLLTRTIKITVYSNIPDLNATKEVSTLLHQIDTIRKNSNRSQPITYSLRPLAALYPLHNQKDITFRALSADLNGNLEQYVLHRRAILTNVKLAMQENVIKFLSGYLEGKCYGAYQQCSGVKKKYFVEIKQLSNLLTGFRSGQLAKSALEDALIDMERTRLISNDNELLQNLNDLERKARLISDLRNGNISYRNAIEHDVDKHDDERTLRTKLMMNSPFVRILCSDDILNKNNHQQLKKWLSDLTEERHKNPDLHLIYADFSYCSYKLYNMILLSSDHIRTNNRDRPMQKSHSSSKDPQRTVPLFKVSSPFESPSTEVHHSTGPPSADKITNILLLGETGVGKSTFINAFANYLTFNSLTQAQSNEPVVVIPVSFIITVGDHFEEHAVQFGKLDSSNNEDFNNVGQSVTQHCKSYVFDLHQFDGKKLRIIDTPGFGDTRGLDQDDRNMEHILQYINNLTHLNAICFLLKPNSSRLNMFFRTCLTQLFSFLNPDARKNVIFCFTNGRSTFYTPGDTAPLLKTMLASASINDIPFKKENTFCFDSESFRYLVALRNNIVFTEEDKHEYQTSWSISVKESNRLTDHIRRNLHPYFIRSGWQSIKHAQFEISHMIRPILEAIRNILRNLILCKMNPPKVLIELHSKAALRPSAICFTCKRQPIQVGSFWIMPDCPHELTNKCWTCSCSTTRHKLIDYVLEYRTMKNPSSFQPNDMNNMLHRLYFASAEFSHFLIHDACSTKDDLFMLGLLQMIREEKDICDKKEAHQMNLQLVNDLEKARHEYEQQMHEIASNQNRKTLTIIYDEIRTVGSYPEIREQMNAAKESQQAAIKQHEVVL